MISTISVQLIIWHWRTHKIKFGKNRGPWTAIGQNYQILSTLNRISVWDAAFQAMHHSAQFSAIFRPSAERLIGKSWLFVESRLVLPDISKCCYQSEKAMLTGYFIMTHNGQPNLCILENKHKFITNKSWKCILLSGTKKNTVFDLAINHYICPW